MSSIRIIAVILAWLASLELRALCQCPELTENVLTELTLNLVKNEANEASDVSSVTLIEFNHNCLAASPTRGYHEATATVKYITNTNITGTAQMALDCPQPGELWGLVQRITLPRDIGNMTVTVEGLLVSETDNSCLRCSPLSGDTESPSFCLSCDDVECDVGLMHCFNNDTSGSQECCNFYDVNDICISECSNNQEPNEDYTCLCSGFFEPQLDCSICNINDSTCINGSPVMETCSCNCSGTGYSGLSCDQDINECIQQPPCANNGSCFNTLGSFNCDCMSGFTGTTCEENIDDCADQPCENGALCHDGVQSYTCECVTGFSGENCEMNIDDCETNSCLNGGMCMDGVDGFTCDCPVGYSGLTCEEDIDECASHPCANGGKCSQGINEFSCRCVGNWRGETCEECFVENCVTAMCDGDQAFCRECSSGFSLIDGTTCVSCSISNCGSCSRDGKCSKCADGYELVADDLCSVPAEPLLSELEIVGLSIGLLVLVVIVAVMVTVGLLVLKKKNWYMPAKKDPGERDKDIILSKITKI